MGLFKTSGTFGAYVHAQLGSDITGDGSRNNPYATIIKALTLGGNVLFSGILNESIPVLTKLITGDSIDFATINGNVVFTGGSSQSPALYNLNINGTLTPFSTLSASNVRNIRILDYLIKHHSLTAGIVSNGFIFATNARYELTLVPVSNCTILNFGNQCSVQYNVPMSNFLFVNSVNLYNTASRSNTTYYPIFQNCLFRKATLWKWNTATIPINWTNNPVGGAAYTDETLMARVYNSLLFYANSLGAGTDKTYFLAILATQDTMFKECVVWDDSDTVNNPIFSRYVDGAPVDYTLALKSNNPALYMSTTGSYVGCYAANVNDDGQGNHITFGAVKHVDETTGLDTATAPDLLIQDPSNPAKFSASQTSLQLWNRIRTSVVEYPRGKSFAGMQSQLDSGIASRLFFGKRQEIRTTGDISQKATAFESVEVIPYDSIPANNNTTQNTINNMSALLPRFSAPFNGECLMFYKGGVPLLFNALLDLFQGAGTVSITSGSPTVTGTGTAFIADFVAGDNIRINGVYYTVLTTPTSNTSLTLTANVAATLSARSYYVGVKTDKSTTIYGTWAVTNADIESYSLLQKATKAGLTTSIPLIKYAKFELNLHYDEE